MHQTWSGKCTSRSTHTLPDTTQAVTDNLSPAHDQANRRCPSSKLNLIDSCANRKCNILSKVHNAQLARALVWLDAGIFASGPVLASAGFHRIGPEATGLGVCGGR